MRDIGESCFAWTKKNDAECQISFLSEIGETCNPVPLVHSQINRSKTFSILLLSCQLKQVLFEKEHLLHMNLLNVRFKVSFCSIPQ